MTKLDSTTPFVTENKLFYLLVYNWELWDLF